MSARARLAWVAMALTVASAVALAGQGPGGAAPRQGTAAVGRTPWGDPDLQGEWTSEGEYGVPFERPAQYGTRPFLTDEEYAKRLEDVRQRDERDLARVNVLGGDVEMPNAPIPHWREYETTSRRSSIVVDPPNGRIPARTPTAKPFPPRQTCGSLQRGEPCDSAQDYGMGVRCIIHGAGFPDAMFPTVYNANFRIVQAPGIVAITYELIHDTRVIPLDTRPHVASAVRMYIGDARAHWEGTTLVVESTNFPSRAGFRGSTDALTLVERFTRTSADAMQYTVTVTDPNTWTAPWTAALDLTARHDPVGVFEYACHEGNYGMFNMLSTARDAERKAREAAPATPQKQ